MPTLLEAAKLNTKARDALPDSDFAVPGKRVMPIHDKAHVEKAWQLKDTTKGLTPEEKAEARRRILSRAKKLGIDTSDWNKMSAAENLHLTGVTFIANAVTIDKPKNAHPNKIYGTGVLTKLNQPSDAPLGGSNGMRVILPSSVAKAALSTLIDMPLNFSNDFDAHQKSQPIGAIYDAAIVGDEIQIKFYLYAVNFPDQVKRIQQEKSLMGFSYEIADVTCNYVGNDLLKVANCTFTGAAILYKDKAAYKTTSLNANQEDKKMSDEILKKLDEKLDALSKENTELKTQLSELSASHKKILEANAGASEAAKPAVDALRSAAKHMEAGGFGGDPKRGHASIARAMANDLEASAAQGQRPQIWQTQDWMNASADTNKSDDKSNEKIKALEAALEEAKKDFDTKVDDLKKQKFMNAEEGERKTIKPEITQLLASTGLQTQDGKKLDASQVSHAFTKAGLTVEQRMAAKAELSRVGAI